MLQIKLYLVRHGRTDLRARNLLFPHHPIPPTHSSPLTVLSPPLTLPHYTPITPLHRSPASPPHRSNDLKLLQGHIDTHLNATGREQSERVGRFLSGSHFDELWRSTLKRCEQTTEVMLRQMPLAPPVRIDARLMDRGKGSWEGKKRRYDIPEPADFESWESVAARAVAWLQDLLARLASEENVNPITGDPAPAPESQTRTILVISHDATIKALLKRLIDPEGPIDTTLAPGVIPSNAFENGSISRVTLTRTPKGWQGVIEGWGEHGHMVDEEAPRTAGADVL